MKLSETLAAAAATAPDAYDQAFLKLSARRAQRMEQEGPQADVRAFRSKFGQAAARFPHWPVDDDAINVQIRLLDEECDELWEAIESRDLAAIAGECVDVVYVILGLMCLLGLPFVPFWRLIHRANMAKVPAPDGGKALKPDGWVKPNLQAELTLITDKALDS